MPLPRGKQVGRGTRGRSREARRPCIGAVRRESGLRFPPGAYSRLFCSLWLPPTSLVASPSGAPARDVFPGSWFRNLLTTPRGCKPKAAGCIFTVPCLHLYRFTWTSAFRGVRLCVPGGRARGRAQISSLAFWGAPLLLFAQIKARTCAPSACRWFYCACGSLRHLNCPWRRLVRQRPHHPCHGSASRAWCFRSVRNPCSALSSRIKCR